MHGILSLTKEPKLEVAIPTEKAKNKEYNTENNSKGFFPINWKKPRNFNLINKNIVNNIMYVFSRADKSITGFFTSHKYGRNNVAAIAKCALLNILTASASNVPIS